MGHTLKLLELPPALEAGLQQVKEAGGMMWEMKQMMDIFSEPDKKKGNVKKEFEKKLEEYVKKIRKVGAIIKDPVPAEGCTEVSSGLYPV